MKYIVTFDIGTTTIKGVLVSTEWQVVSVKNFELNTIFEGDFQEQSPLQWYEGFCSISKEFAQEVDVRDITAVVMSGQMQDLILLDADAMPVANAILYSDSRAQEEAETIIERIGGDRLEEITGNHFDASIPFAKLLWVQRHLPHILSSTHKVVFSSKDAVIARLCGTFISDVTTCSTVGLQDIQTKQWRKDWLRQLDLPERLLPRLLYAEDLAGTITAAAALECGLAAGTKVYAGTGDAGATTLASGITKSGDYNINLGTSGWVATVSHDIVNGTGVFNLAAMPKERIVNVVPFFNAGNVNKWISNLFSNDESTVDVYAYANQLLEDSHPGSNGVFCLPYLLGERFPVVDGNVRGAFVGLTPETRKSDFIRAALEGVAYSIRQGMDSLQAVPNSISLVGGGAKSMVWCQILADVLGHTIRVYANSEYTPSLAIAAAARIAAGEMEDYSEVTEIIDTMGGMREYNAIAANHEIYDAAYAKYLKLYPAIGSIELA